MVILKSRPMKTSQTNSNISIPNLELWYAWLMNTTIRTTKNLNTQKSLKTMNNLNYRTNWRLENKNHTNRNDRTKEIEKNIKLMTRLNKSINQRLKNTMERMHYTVRKTLIREKTWRMPKAEIQRLKKSEA